MKLRASHSSCGFFPLDALLITAPQNGGFTGGSHQSESPQTRLQGTKRGFSGENCMYSLKNQKQEARFPTTGNSVAVFQASGLHDVLPKLVKAELVSVVLPKLRPARPDCENFGGVKWARSGAVLVVLN